MALKGESGSYWGGTSGGFGVWGLPTAGKDLAWDYPGVKVQGECLLFLLLLLLLTAGSVLRRGFRGREGAGGSGSISGGF